MFFFSLVYLCLAFYFCSISRSPDLSRQLQYVHHTIQKAGFILSMSFSRYSRYKTRVFLCGSSCLRGLPTSLLGIDVKGQWQAFPLWCFFSVQYKSYLNCLLPSLSVGWKKKLATKQRVLGARCFTSLQWRRQLFNPVTVLLFYFVVGYATSFA